MEPLRYTGQSGIPMLAPCYLSWSIVSEVLLFLYFITVCIIFNDKHGMELILSCWMLVCWRLVVFVGLFAFVISGVFLCFCPLIRGLPFVVVLMLL